MSIIAIVGVAALLGLLAIACLGTVCMAVGERCGICQGGQR